MDDDANFVGPICAYPDYVRDEPWRIFRIMAELVESFETMSKQGPLVTIFGSARTKAVPESCRPETRGHLKIMESRSA